MPVFESLEFLWWLVGAVVAWLQNVRVGSDLEAMGSKFVMGFKYPRTLRDLLCYKPLVGKVSIFY